MSEEALRSLSAEVEASRELAAAAELQSKCNVALLQEEMDVSKNLLSSLNEWKVGMSCLGTVLWESGKRAYSQSGAWPPGICEFRNGHV